MLELAGSLSLRPFALADVGAVEPWLKGPGLSLPCGSLRHEWPQRLLADARIVAMVGEIAGRQVGFLRLDCGPDGVAEITLVVAPGRRRSGWGSAMFAAALTKARALGLRGVIACIDGQNGAALAFFAAHGFEQDGMVGDRIRMHRLVHAGGSQPPLDIG
jgi:GNAT superfamily N-acetyltransferase